MLSCTGYTGNCIHGGIAVEVTEIVSRDILWLANCWVFKGVSYSIKGQIGTDRDVR